MGTTRTTIIALVYQGWMSMDDHTAVRFIAIDSSAFVMWFLLCAMSLGFVVHGQMVVVG